MNKSNISLRLIIVSLAAVCLISFGIAILLIEISDGKGSARMEADVEINSVITNYDLKNFSKLNLDGHANVYIRQSDEYSVELRLNNYRNNIDIYVMNGELYVKQKSNRLFGDWCRRDPVLYISMPVLEKIYMDGMFDMQTQGLLKGDSIVIRLNGAGDIDMNLEYKKIELVNKGIGDINVNGVTKDLRVELDGMGNIDAKNLIAKNVEVSLDGTGDIKVYAEDELDAELDGLGDIEYYGDPEKVNRNVDGLGKIKKH